MTTPEMQLLSEIYADVRSINTRTSVIEGHLVTALAEIESIKLWMRRQEEWRGVTEGRIATLEKAKAESVGPVRIAFYVIMIAGMLSVLVGLFAR